MLSPPRGRCSNFILSMTHPNLIYTQGSLSSSVSEQQAIGAEAKSGIDCIAHHESSHCERRAVQPSRAVHTETDTGNSPEADGQADLPKVPSPVTFAGKRTDYRHVLACLCDSRRGIALKYFRGRYSTSNWMEQQKGWLENASLLASTDPFSFNPIRVLYCSRKGRLCCEPDYCFRCNLDQRVEPLQKAFERAYRRRPFWHSMVLNYEMDAGRAGIWTGSRGDRKALHLPHQGNTNGRFFRCCPHQLRFVKMFCDFLFHVVGSLKKSGVIDGWLAVVEPSLSFWPDPAAPCHWWCGIDHAFLPHIHVLVCGYHPLDDRLIRAIYDTLQQFLGAWSHANFWFNPVTSQAGIKKWINYCVKPFPLADWYNKAIHSRCDQSNLNLLFDDVAIQTCSGMMSKIYSPRRGGVLASNSRDACILDPLPPLLTQKQMAQCKDERFYFQHEDSFWRNIEKRESRRGRDFRYRTRTHRAAVRRIAAREEEGKPGRHPASPANTLIAAI